MSVSNIQAAEGPAVRDGGFGASRQAASGRLFPFATGSCWAGGGSLARTAAIRTFEARPLSAKFGQEPPVAGDLRTAQAKHSAPESKRPARGGEAKGGVMPGSKSPSRF